MKKKILSIMLALLLLLAITPAAYAERTESCFLGNFAAGEQINAFIANIDINAQIGSVIMPDGCSLEIENTGNVSKLYLRGSISVPGLVNFTLPIVGEENYSISCAMQIESSAPIVSQSADISCKLGDTCVISVSARAVDGGSLSYQWYSVSNGRIEGATNSTYYPNTFLVGEQQYYCEVSSSNGGFVNTTRSGNIKVEVAGVVTVSGISIFSPAEKLSYAVGETVDTTGLILNVDYSDGSKNLIATGFEAAPRFFNVNGRQVVEIRYEGRSLSYEVMVGTDLSELEGIGVLERPDKTLYKVGDKLDTTGLVVRAYLKGNRTQDLQADELECSPKEFKEAGAQKVTVKYGEKTCTFSVTVEEDKTEIKIASLPAKTVYTVGDKLDTAGLSITVTNGGRTETISSGFTCTPKVLTTAGAQEVTVIYGGVNKCTFNVTVNEKEVKTSATPAPTTNTPRPTTPPVVKVTPSTAPTPIRHEAHTTNFAGTLMKVIVVIALFSLVGLGAYVMVMRKKGQR